MRYSSIGMPPIENRDAGISNCRRRAQRPTAEHICQDTSRQRVTSLHLLAKPELNGAHMRAGAAAALKSLQAERPKPVVLLLGDVEARRVSPKSDVRLVSLKS